MKINLIEAIKAFVKRKEDFSEFTDLRQAITRESDLPITCEHMITDFITHVHNQNKRSLERLNSDIIRNSKKLAGYFLYCDGKYLADIVTETEEQLEYCEHGSSKWHYLRGKLDGLYIVQSFISNNEV